MKTKDLHFRVTQEFYDLYDAICKKLDCSKTDFFIENCLCIDGYTKLVVENDEEELRRLYANTSASLNQIARTLNYMMDEHRRTGKSVEDLVATNNINILIRMLEKAREEFREIDLLMREDRSKLHRVTKQRELLEEVTEYLNENDPEYLEVLRDRGRTNEI